nr:plasmid recombination enzyme (plasmid) [Bacillus sp.] [Bacillus sp. (in: firmicutes)]
MSYAVCRMQKVKSAGLKGMQFHNQRERKSRTNDDIDHERTRENYDLKNDKNIDYNERVKEIIESQKTGTRKTRKDAVLVNELLVTSDRDFFEQLDPGEQKRFFEESYKLFSERYGKQNIAYATVHNDEQTPHMHLGVVPMRDGKLQGKNVFNRQELLWLQDKFPVHMKKQGFELKRGERGSDRKHIETAKFKKQTLEKEIDLLESELKNKKSELAILSEEVSGEFKIPVKREKKSVEVPTGKRNLLGIEQKKTVMKSTGNVILKDEVFQDLKQKVKAGAVLQTRVDQLLNTDYAKENQSLKKEVKELRSTNKSLSEENGRLKSTVEHLTNEIESLYVLTKDFLKVRTNDLERFKELFGVFVGKVKEKAPRGLFVRHERSEEKKNTFSLQDVLQRDRELREQRKAKRKKSHDLER